MGIADDAPYVLMAHSLASTGRIVYNGWPAAMLGWQLYLGAAFDKLFGISFTSVRMANLLVAAVMAFILERTFVRLNLSERNATIGTLAFVLCPLYLLLSVTFMSDICGLFAIVVCLYGCLRALQSSTERSAIGWLCFAVATNAVCGTARQIAWLGLLVMVPSVLWLLRAQRRVLMAGLTATFTGALFILACMHWFARQPYVQQEHLLPRSFPVGHIFFEFLHMFLDIPFQLLPIFALFLPTVFKSRLRVATISVALTFVYVLWALHATPHNSAPLEFHRSVLLEPLDRDTLGFNTSGMFNYPALQGDAPRFLSRGMQVVLTVVSFGSLLGVILSLLRLRTSPPRETSSIYASWKQFCVVLLPFTIAYLLLLVPRAASSGIYDRYPLVPLMIAVPFLVRFFQERIRRHLPLASVLLVAIMGACGITTVHNTFAIDRERVAMAAELRSYGVPDTSVDNGWEYNLAVELKHANHLNDFRIALPADAYTRIPRTNNRCPMFGYEDVPHIHPLYSISFDPNACYGPAPFAPVTYSRWPAFKPGILYVVRSVPAQR
jgi:hypothetical protein